MTITREQMIEQLCWEHAAYRESGLPKRAEITAAILAELTAQSGNGKMKSADQWAVEYQQYEVDSYSIISFINAIQADAINAKQDGMTIPELPEGKVLWNLCWDGENEIWQVVIGDDAARLTEAGRGKTPREAVLAAIAKIPQPPKEHR
jgi:hypothetical protein